MLLLANGKWPKEEPKQEEDEFKSEPWERVFIPVTKNEAIVTAEQARFLKKNIKNSTGKETAGTLSVNVEIWEEPDSEE